MCSGPQYYRLPRLPAGSGTYIGMCYVCSLLIVHCTFIRWFERISGAIGLMSFIKTAWSAQCCFICESRPAHCCFLQDETDD